MTYKHIKLTNGEEFIANVLDVQEDEGVIIMSEALKIVEAENLDEGYSYFAFRPLMSFTENTDKLQILNLAHIVVETTPSENIMRHYHNTLNKMKRYSKGGLTMEELEESSDEDFEKYMKLLEAMEEEMENPEKDPRGDNIVKFKRPKDTFH